VFAQRFLARGAKGEHKARPYSPYLSGFRAHGCAVECKRMAIRIIGLALLMGMCCALAADAPADGWKNLFDGKSLNGWKSSGYGGGGETRVEDGKIVIPMGDRLSGITYTGNVPHMNYEVELEARRVLGSDFFVGLTFPVGDAHASLILGGWGGAVCGISSLDGEDANTNKTRKVVRFKKDQWYKVRLRVEPQRLQAWLDDKPLIDADTKGKQIDIRPEIAPSKPFGLATFTTTAEVKSIRLRTLGAEKTKN
jgi:hypothetical protein